MRVSNLCHLGCQEMPPWEMTGELPKTKKAEGTIQEGPSSQNEKRAELFTVLEKDPQTLLLTLPGLVPKRQTSF